MFHTEFHPNVNIN